MAIGKIEPTGCTVRKGKVQLRLSFYLEPGDARYEEHHVSVPIIPDGGYPGEVDAEGAPVDQEHYDSWFESLDREERDNPFHNHLVYVDADATDAEIKQLMADCLEEFFGVWAKGEKILEAWQDREKLLKVKKELVAGSLSEENGQRCQDRGEDIKKRAAEFEVSNDN